jgi:hypothetical protein
MNKSALLIVTTAAPLKLLSPKENKTGTGNNLTLNNFKIKLK